MLGRFIDDKYDKQYKEGVRFHQVSTDEVYGARVKAYLWKQCPYYQIVHTPHPRQVLTYLLEHTMRPMTSVTTSRCSNNYGAYQFPEKLIPS